MDKPEGAIPVDQFTPDSTDQQSTPAPENSIPVDQFVPDQPPEGAIPVEHFKSDEDKFTTPSQQALTGLEGFVRGRTAGISDAMAAGMRKAASFFGVPEEDLHYVAPSPENMSARQKENPIESTGAELAGSFGLAKALPKIGSRAISSMIHMGIISGGDELSKNMLGKGDPGSAAAAHIAEAGAAGLLLGGVFGKTEKLGVKGLKALENKKLGSKISSVLTGVGHAASFPGEEIVPLASSALTAEEAKMLDDKSFKYGQKLFKHYMVTTPKYVARVAAPTLGGMLGGWGGAAASTAIEQGLEHMAPQLSKKVAPVVLKAAASGSVDDLGHLIDHATTMEKGAKKISNGVEALFKSGSNEYLNHQSSEKDREKLRDFIEDGGIQKEIQDESQNQTQGFAHGGEVKNHIETPNAVARVYPEQHVMLSAAKGRVSNYLNSIRPIGNQNKLIYDKERKNPTKERAYNKTLDMANQPLSILKHIKNGSLVPNQVNDFKNMYPELHQDLSNKITERIMKGKEKDEKSPPYHTRQALSLFLGSNLDSSLTPQSIQAAQGVFMKQKAQQQVPQTKTSSLNKIGQQTMTAEQSRTQRLNKD